MKAVVRLAGAALLAVAALAAVGAAQTDATNTTIAEYLQSDDRFTAFVALLEENNLLDQLNSTDTQYTVFAPTNEVLEQFDFNATGLDAAEVLRYHIVPGLFSRDNFSEVTPPGNSLPLRPAPPTEEPTAEPSPTASESGACIPAAAPAVSRLAVRQANGDAPADDEDGEAAVNFVGNLSSVTLKTLLDLDSIDNQAQRLKVLGNDEQSLVFVNNVSVSEPDIETANGFIHVIDGVLVPPGNVTDVVDELPRNFSLWDALLERLNLTDVVTESNATVFVPVDFSFVKRNESSGGDNETETESESSGEEEPDPEQLVQAFFDAFNDSQWRDIIEAMVVPGDVLYTDDLAAQLAAVNASNGDAPTLTFTTALGTQLNISVANRGESYKLTIEDGRSALIARNPRLFDIPTASGVLHIIDAPLIPESVLREASLEAFLFGIGARDFAVALNETGAISTLAQGNFTLFVPTDAAFDRLNSTAPLEEIVDLHIVAGKPELLDGTELKPLDDNVTLLINHDEFAFTVRVLEGDSFGFITEHFSLDEYEVYVIDNVLVPPPTQ